MTLRLFTLAIAVQCAIAVLCAGQATAQSPRIDSRDARENLSTLEASVSSPSDLEIAPPTVKEMRMARAQYRDRQRVARMEYNLWMGYEPLRPRWNSMPTMSSRYGRPTIYVPVYVQH